MISKETFLKQIIEPTLYYEGGYSNNPLDKGGETYRGITRKNFPFWPGWRFVDDAKPLANNAYVLKAEPLVRDFYYTDFFQFHKFHELNSVKVAAALFDFAVHGGYSVKGLQTLLNNQFGEKLVIDGKIGPLTIAAVNRANESKLVNAIMDWRKGYLDKVIQNNPSQQVFEKGWNNRLTSLSNVLGVVKENPVKSGLVVLLIVGLVGWFVFFRKGVNNEKLD